MSLCPPYPYPSLSYTSSHMLCVCPCEIFWDNRNDLKTSPWVFCNYREDSMGKRGRAGEWDRGAGREWGQQDGGAGWGK